MNSKILFYLILFTLLALLIPAMHAQTFSVIHTFTGGRDGLMPGAGVTIRGKALYGTTIGDYAKGGSVYQLTNNGSHLAVFHPFDSCPQCQSVRQSRLRP